jgi:hypothetical protein
MIRSFLRRWTDDGNLPGGGSAILLALAIGIGGLMFVFSIPDPFASLARQQREHRLEYFHGMAMAGKA